jgi:hypothetical protein
MPKFKTIITAFIFFLAGYFVSNLTHNTPLESSSPNLNSANQYNESNGFFEKLDESLNNSNASNITALMQKNQNKILEVLQNLPEKKINHYLEQAFPDQDIDVINDKRKFSERLIEELNQDKDESKTLSGQVYMSMSQSTPRYSESINQVNAQQYIYAHFDTFGKAPPNKQVFVKWINQDTEEVVLFTPKYIVENSTQNWVSAVPPNGWKPGQYSVKFYQMTDSLTPIAQSSYTISSVQN